MQGKLLKYIHSFTFTYFLVSICNQARIKDFPNFFVDAFFSWLNQINSELSQKAIKILFRDSFSARLENF